MMVEVFITDIANKRKVIEVVEMIAQTYSELKVNFDFDETGLPYPLGHTVLRIEGRNIDAKKIILIVKEFDFYCEIMEDKIAQ